MDRLTIRDSDGYAHATRAGLYDYINKLAEYEDLEEQGLLLRLPCKVGDVVYKINKASKKIESYIVIKFDIEKSDTNTFTMQIWFENYTYCFFSHFGKTVFPTKAEAEEALKKMEKA